MTTRKATVTRKTLETEIALSLDLDTPSKPVVDTGIGFLDHLFTLLAHHAGFGLSLSCRGDVHVDDHHSAEDCAIALGEALAEALGDRTGIVRFGWAYAPLEESLARAVVDLASRPHAEISLSLERERIGALACENIPHLLRSLAMAARFTLHVDVLRGENDHHRAEAAVKALALALKAAVASGAAGAASTKGVL